MPVIAEETQTDVRVPRRLKISSKRQITIPKDIFDNHGFNEYALLTETEEGFSIQPVSLAADDEELTVKLLQYLIEQGCEGEELIEQYQDMKPKFLAFKRAIERSEADIAAGRVIGFDEMQRLMREKYGQ